MHLALLHFVSVDAFRRLVLLQLAPNLCTCRSPRCANVISRSAGETSASKILDHSQSTHHMHRILKTILRDKSRLELL